MQDSTLRTARHLLTQAQSLRSINNWLYRHAQLLREFGIITGNQTIKELKKVTKAQVDASHYAGAMTTLRKLNDIHIDDFYDFNSYELVPLKEIKYRILHLH